jgi:hypothetical protein
MPEGTFEVTQEGALIKTSNIGDKTQHWKQIAVFPNGTYKYTSGSFLHQSFSHTTDTATPIGYEETYA